MKDKLCTDCGDLITNEPMPACVPVCQCIPGAGRWWENGSTDITEFLESQQPFETHEDYEAYAFEQGWIEPVLPCGGCGRCSDCQWIDYVG